MPRALTISLLLSNGSHTNAQRKSDYEIHQLDLICSLTTDCTADLYFWYAVDLLPTNAGQ